MNYSGLDQGLARQTYTQQEYEKKYGVDTLNEVPAQPALLVIANERFAELLRAVENTLNRLDVIHIRMVGISTRSDEPTPSKLERNCHLQELDDHLSELTTLARHLATLTDSFSKIG